MGFAVRVEDRLTGVGAEADGSVLVGYACDGDLLAEIDIVMDCVILDADVFKQRFKLGLESLMAFQVVRRVAELDFAFWRERHSVFSKGKVLGREPKVDGVGGQDFKCEMSAIVFWNTVGFGVFEIAKIVELLCAM